MIPSFSNCAPKLKPAWIRINPNKSKPCSRSITSCSSRAVARFCQRGPSASQRGNGHRREQRRELTLRCFLGAMRRRCGCNMSACRKNKAWPRDGTSSRATRSSGVRRMSSIPVRSSAPGVSSSCKSRPRGLITTRQASVGPTVRTCRPAMFGRAIHFDIGKGSQMAGEPQIARVRPHHDQMVARFGCERPNVVEAKP
jgi:hypothetical protein